MLLGMKTIIVILVFLVGIPLLQIFLSKREARWPGLVLPLISFLYSLLLLVNLLAGTPGWQVAATFLCGNIPTVILLAIYAACREKRRKNSAVEKMNIQDL